MAVDTILRRSRHSARSQSTRLVHVRRSPRHGRANVRIFWKCPDGRQLPRGRVVEPRQIFGTGGDAHVPRFIKIEELRDRRGSRHNAGREGPAISAAPACALRHATHRTRRVLRARMSCQIATALSPSRLMMHSISKGLFANDRTPVLKPDHAGLPQQIRKVSVAEPPRSAPTSPQLSTRRTKAAVPCRPRGRVSRPYRCCWPLRVSQQEMRTADGRRAFQRRHDFVRHHRAVLLGVARDVIVEAREQSGLRASKIAATRQSERVALRRCFSIRRACAASDG